MPPTNGKRGKNQADNPANSPSAPSTTNRPITRTETRKNGDSLILEEDQDVNDTLEGRKFLEKHLLLCPPGEPPTHASLATCLHQISAMSGIQKPVLNAIRSVAFLLEELEETQINLTVKEAFDSQTTEFTSDMKMLIEDAKDKINIHLKETEDRLTQMVNEVTSQAKQARPNSYAAILQVATPPPHANPRIAAKEGIKARQFLIEGINGTKFAHLDVFQLKTELNKLLAETGLTNGKIRSASSLRNGGTLIELDSDDSTTWMTNQENRNKFSQKIGPNVVFKTRAHSIIAFNVPIAINPENEEHRKEICEANNLEHDVITTMRWIKPLNRRTPEQRTAHLILTLSSADTANRAITNGISICNRRCHVERTKREPIRCLKCQGWNHYAKDCIEKEDSCGNCAKKHRTSQCPNPAERRCVSCKMEGHASWSRECPTFVKKSNEFNERNPENTLQYIPTSDPWTWTAKEKQVKATPPPQTRPPYLREQSQPPKRPQMAPRKYDTYIPNYEKRASGHLMDWEDREDPRRLNEFRPLTQKTVDAIDKEVTIGENIRRPENLISF
jgi:hypothetical protein